MANDNTSLELVQNQQLMNENEWVEYIRPIQEVIDEVRKQYGDASNDYVYTRLGPGGESVDYVREEFFVEILNEHFPDWSFIITKTGYIGQLVYVSGRLILNFKGVRRVFDDTGEDKAMAMKDGTMVPGAVKSATTDCFKRCCHRALGAARNVYNKIDLERAVNVERVRSVVKYIEGILGEPEPAISTDNYSKLESAHEYFTEKQANLPTTDNGWVGLNQALDKLDKLKEVIDAERTRD